MPDDHEDNDRSIIDALSSLGWQEESEEPEPIKEDSSVLEQYNFLKKQYKKLQEDLSEKASQVDNLNRDLQEITNEKRELMIRNEEQALEIDNLFQTIEKNRTDTQLIIEEKDKMIQELNQNIQDLTQDAQIQDNQDSSIGELTETLNNKDQEIEQLYSQLYEQKKQIEENNSMKAEHEQNIKELSINLEQAISLQTDYSNQVQLKENKIKELMEQVKYLESDTIQRSKYDKLEILVEKKDEIITEKEKNIFELNNTLTSANQKINNLQQQLETFSLLKKDLEKKETRIQSLLNEIDDLKHEVASKSEIIGTLEEKLNDSQGIMSKYQENSELLNQKELEISQLKHDKNEINNRFLETEQIEERILSDLQKLKDQNLILETKLEEKDHEIIELKKKIKLLRRDLFKP